MESTTNQPVNVEFNVYMQIASVDKLNLIVLNSTRKAQVMSTETTQ